MAIITKLCMPCHGGLLASNSTSSPIIFIALYSYIKRMWVAIILYPPISPPLPPSPIQITRTNFTLSHSINYSYEPRLSNYVNKFIMTVHTF